MCMFCFPVCVDGYYGDSCSLRCGRCKDNKPCDQTGHCPVNCTNVGHWQYPKCQGEILNTRRYLHCTKISSENRGLDGGSGV